jgi:hypothetical protein
MRWPIRNGWRCTASYRTVRASYKVTSLTHGNHRGRRPRITASTDRAALAPFEEQSSHRGTTVSLLDQVAAGTFSERLFYRLNIIHLMAEDGSPEAVLV